MLLGFMPWGAYSDFHYKFYNYKIIYYKLKDGGFNIIRTDSSYLFVSCYFNKYIGKIGEWLGSIFPKYGEGFIIYAQKNP